MLGMGKMVEIIITKMMRRFSSIDVYHFMANIQNDL